MKNNVGGMKQNVHVRKPSIGMKNIIHVMKNKFPGVV
jgi:hypothetical protein